MNLSKLKYLVETNLPIYLGEKIVIIIDVFELFNLVEVKFIDNDETFVVDIITLKEESYNDEGIPLNLIKNDYVK
ncbi:MULTISPECIES: hypothetical protein [unclassified Clostridioides]|uniref:hypothetical protein n=1 Tax=unclassified Clostridioides TaxID=2635829 RepID=UPI001D127C95|nr:hypothetical protein [Clostridioides sp. ES-S-0145-01]MCC0682342.1 hypothetical protein [Clostridioides sp. ES-S-0005-03]MCC0705499.1 hypothetical protein [Clostridioides sp. ES-S-0190-01]UDN64002.1 hypothetical protein IC758_20625 [Clostridioides sp. ES-W-0016-02]